MIRSVRRGLKLMLAAAACLAAHGQTFTRLAFQDGKATLAAGLRLQLHEPDNPTSPTLWQGPLSISGGSWSCHVSASLIRDVFLSPTGKLAILVALSGSETSIDFFSTRDCTPMWPSLTSFSSRAVVHQNLLELHPACEAASGGYSCSAASVYRLSERVAPRRLPVASLALTKEIFGVSFTGSRMFAHLPPALVAVK